MKILKSLFHWVPEAVVSARLYPYTVASTFASLAFSLHLIFDGLRGYEPGAEHIERMLAISASMIALTFAISLFSNSKRMLEAGLVAASLALLTIFYHLNSGDSDQLFYQKLCLFAFAFHLAVSIAPFVHERNENAFWNFNRRLFERAILTGIYSGVLYIGIAIAIWSLELLFGIKTDEKWYGTAASIVGFPVTTLFLIAGVPTANQAETSGEKQPTEYPAPLRILITNVALPLIALYFAILYAYAAKIIFTQTWPDGSIGWLVSSLAVVVILTHLLSLPIQKDADKPFVRWITRNVFRLTLPLLILLFMAIYKRVDAYGWTQARVILFATGLWSFGISVAWSTSKRYVGIFWIPATLMVLTLVMSTGPLSSFSIAYRSQQARLEKLLREKPLELGKPEENQKRYDFKARFQLSRALDYICENKGGPGLETALNISLGSETDSAPRKRRCYSEGRFTAATAMERFGLKYLDRWESKIEVDQRMFSASEIWAADLENLGLTVNKISFSDHGFDGALPVQTWTSGFTETKFDKQKRTLSFTLLKTKTAVTFDLSELIEKLGEKFGKEAGAGLEQPEAIQVKSGMSTLLIQSIHLESRGDKTVIGVISLDGHLFTSQR
ncbi:MAG: DUF4153 domain-containing protein [Bdellovibrionota bacterium]